MSQFYRLKQEQRKRNRDRCEYCRKKGPTSSHHLFARRPDHPYIHVDINIVQLCWKCHADETLAMQVKLATKKLDRYGPEEIENWAANAPFKLPIKLPSHYWGAKSVWRDEQNADSKDG